MNHTKAQGALLADKAWGIRYRAMIEKNPSPEERINVQEQILAMLQEAVEMSKANDDMLDLSYSLAKYAQIRGYVDGTDVALKFFRESADAAKKGDSPFLQGHAIRHMADLLRHRHEYERAESMYEQALELLRSDPETDELSIGNLLRPMAILLEQTGRLQEATERWRETRDFYKKAGIPAGIEECDAHLSKLTSK